MGNTVGRNISMNHYRIAICEDEAFYREELVMLLTTYENESGNGIELDVYSSGEEFLEKSGQKRYHIVILDVEMGLLSGVDIARSIRKYDEQVQIIFATSHERYAVDAFDVMALGYLVKPVSYVKLKKILYKAIMLTDFIKDREAAKKRYIQVKVKYETVNIQVDTIRYIEKKRNQSIIHGKENEYSCYETLTQLYEKLDINTFVYTHQGYIVNYDKIQQVLESSVILEDYIEIPLSRKYYQAMKERFIKDVYEGIR